MPDLKVKFYTHDVLEGANPDEDKYAACGPPLVHHLHEITTGYESGVELVRALFNAGLQVSVHEDTLSAIKEEDRP